MRIWVLAWLALSWVPFLQASDALSPVPPGGVSASARVATATSESKLPGDTNAHNFSSRFDSLFDAAVFFLLLENDPRWQPIEAGPLLAQGDRHPQVAKLRTLLRLYGDLADPEAGPDADYFDPALRQGLLRFQSRHGAKVDGILGPKTRALLNVSPARRADQLMVNIQRMEAMDAKPPSRFVMVNIPEFRLRMVEDEQIVLEMKTIIGRKTRKTPVLESQIESLVINPSWNVPRGIAYKDILPKWRADKDYLDKHNLKVLAGWGREAPEVPADQASYERFYRGDDFLRFWQPPGEDNALGRLKFVFPNDHTVFMHDTPTRALFDERVRAFSSGCVRVEKPELLAESLLRWSGEETLLSSLYQGGSKTRWVRLAHPVPVYFTYWTAWVDRDRVLHFGEDIYQLDAQARRLHLAM